MFTVPFATIGVILMLFFTKTTFNVQSYIGCIMLGGIVLNNAILPVDHTNLLRHRDAMPLREAIEEAGRRRLRSILMTAMTTLLAMVPLALGLREGWGGSGPSGEGDHRRTDQFNPDYPGSRSDCVLVVRTPIQEGK
jgi:HAE1 family hydrophobic/amphiphilic exporter-1